MPSEMRLQAVQRNRGCQVYCNKLQQCSTELLVRRHWMAATQDRLLSKQQSSSIVLAVAAPNGAPEYDRMPHAARMVIIWKLCKSCHARR